MKIRTCQVKSNEHFLRSSAYYQFDLEGHSHARQDTDTSTKRDNPRHNCIFRKMWSYSTVIRYRADIEKSVLVRVTAIPYTRTDPKIFILNSS
jgi:hypothetical protein